MIIKGDIKRNFKCSSFFDGLPIRLKKKWWSLSIFLNWKFIFKAVLCMSKIKKNYVYNIVTLYLNKEWLEITCTLYSSFNKKNIKCEQNYRRNLFPSCNIYKCWTISDLRTCLCLKDLSHWPHWWTLLSSWNKVM